MGRRKQDSKEGRKEGKGDMRRKKLSFETNRRKENAEGSNKGSMQGRKQARKEGKGNINPFFLLLNPPPPQY